MRRREKFVISSVVLSLGLFGVQLVSLEWRYLAVAVHAVLTYIVSAWALSDDLQAFEWATILPFPVLYSAAVGLFYFLLPAGLLSRLFILGLFGIGMYALFLTSNIYSVAKGKTIQLIHAAHAIALLFTLLTSLLFTNTIFSLKLPFYSVGVLVGLVHFPIIFMSLWAVNLEQIITNRIVWLAIALTVIITELAIILAILPVSVWNAALLVMAILYIGLGLLHNFLRGILFGNTMTEYSLVGALVAVVFLLIFPFK